MHGLSVLDDLQARARKLLPPAVYDSVVAGAGTEAGLSSNLAGWAEVQLRPRRLVDVSQVRTSGEVLGVPVSLPVLLAPAGRHRLLHPDGEAATAAAVHAEGTVMCLATRSTTDVHDIVPIAPGRVWLQLYVATDRGYTSAVLHAARAAGVQRVVVTVDRPVAGARPRAQRHGAVPLPEGVADASHLGAGVPRPDGLRYDLALTFDDLSWIAGHGLAVTVKGVLRGDDARRCIEYGADSVIVSNHGGRQLDASVPTAVALRDVVRAVEAPVLVDGGIRRGVDVLRALAIGAKAVLIGRPYLWGLAVAGAPGIRRVLDHLRAEMNEAMTLTGCASLADLSPDLLAVRSH